MERVDELIALLREAVESLDDDQVDLIKEELAALAKSSGTVQDHIEMASKQELLEIRWELEEVLEAVSDKKPEPEPEPEPEEPELKADDLVLVYDDPRGLLLHVSPDETRWFATQMDPATGQPVTFELPAEQILGIKQQLAGSPHWIKKD